MQNGLCIIANASGTNPRTLKGLLRALPYRWTILCESEVKGFKGARRIGDLPPWLEPVGYYDQPFLKHARAIYRFAEELEAAACWVIGPAEWAFVALQARAAGMAKQPCRWIISPVAATQAEAGTPDESAEAGGFPELLLAGYASRCAETLADRIAPDLSDAAEFLKSATANAPQATSVSKAEANPLLSVCIAHYNYGPYLLEQLASLRAQTYPNFEVIVVDDGSTDAASLAIWNELPAQFPEPHFHFHRREANLGLSPTRNEAVAHAQGDWLVFCDADNRSHPQMLERLATAAQTSNADVITCYGRLFKLDETNIEQTVEYVAPLGDCIELGWLFNVFGDANSLIRRSVYESVGGFKSQPGESSEDWRLFAELAWNGARFQVVPSVLFEYRVHGASVMRTTSAARSLRGLRAIYEAQMQSLPAGRRRQFWEQMFAALPHFHAWREKAEKFWREVQEMWHIKREQDEYLARLNGQLAEAHEALSKSEARMQQAWDDRKQMESFLSGQLEDAKARWSELSEAQKAATAATDAQLAQLRDQLNAAAANLKQAWDDRREMEAFLSAQLEAGDQQLAATQTQIERDAQQFAALSAELASSQQLLASAWADRQKMEAFLQSQIAGLERQVADREEQLSAARAELSAELSAAHRQLEQTWKDRREMEAFLQSQIADRDMQVASSTNLIADRESQLSNVRAELSAELSAAHRQLEQGWNDRREMEAFLKTQIGHRDERIAGLEAHTGEQQTRSEALASELSELKSQHQALQTRCADAEAQRDLLATWAGQPAYKRLFKKPEGLSPQ